MDSSTKKTNMIDQMVRSGLRQRKAIVLSDSEDEQPGTKRKGAPASASKPRSKTQRKNTHVQSSAMEDVDADSAVSY